MGVEEAPMLLVLVKSQRSQYRRDDRNLRLELHVHEIADHRIGGSATVMLRPDKRSRAPAIARSYRRWGLSLHPENDRRLDRSGGADTARARTCQSIDQRWRGSRPALEHFPPKWTSRASAPVFAGYGSATRKCDKPTNLERILAQACQRVVQYERNAL
jgi:hypothetical protein